MTKIIKFQFNLFKINLYDCFFCGLFQFIKKIILIYI